jgi:hypothetical protein
MRRCLIFCALLAGACGRPIPAPEASPEPLADPALFRPAPGWTGAAPTTELELVLAAEAELAGRLQANAQLSALADIYGVPR